MDQKPPLSRPAREEMVSLPDQPTFYLPVLTVLPCPQCNRAMAFCCPSCTAGVLECGKNERADNAKREPTYKECFCQVDMDERKSVSIREPQDATSVDDSYWRLSGACKLTAQWLRFSEDLFVRPHITPELNVTYVLDDNAAAYRRFGSDADWQLVSDYMKAFHSGFMVIDLSVEQTTFFQANNNRIAKTHPASAMERLLADPSVVGYMRRGSGENVEFFYVDVSSMPHESDAWMQRKRFIVRDKLQMALIRLFRGVATWWP